jgi:myo-inositol 2-dehydrogenase / D-chiro-inositol 1-dehydrogenase
MSEQQPGSSRRDFLKTTTAAAVGSSLAGWTVIPGAYAQGSDEIRIGLIGAGGRGSGAVADVFKGHEAGVRLVAIADMFPDRTEAALKRLNQQYGARAAVKPEHVFTGFDGYQKVLAVPDVNYVILASPPGFRPTHLEAAILAGKNTFTEKPVAVDGPGIRKVMALAKEADAKGLSIVGGTQRRHQHGYIETMKRVHDGAIGEVVGMRAYWNQGFLWKRDRQPEWTDMEWQLRNWLYFTWLSGDHIVEQHIHNIDVINWVKQGHPASAMGMGGRQVRTDKAYGHIFDHFAIDYEYPDGSHSMSMCRQIDNCANSVSEAIVGTKGSAQLDKYEIKGAAAWKGEKDPISPYVQEHIDLIRTIRSGQRINELQTVAESTLTAIMGRMSAYTGKAVTWDEALNSNEALVPTSLQLGPIPTPPVPMPGQATN